MINLIKNRWTGPGGCAEILRLAFPLILSTSAYTVQLFVNRMFLAWYSTDTLSAAVPAGITSFVFVSFFLGTASYVNTFVAQYTGANRPGRVGPAVWQGLYFAIVAGVAVLPLIPVAEKIFDWFGHDPAVRQHEVAYFKILCLAVAPTVLGSAITCFFTGRGLTWTVFAVNAVATGVNILVDYTLIFGRWGFPELGITGAGWGTLIAESTATTVMIIIFLRRKNRQKFDTLRGAKPNLDLFKRLMRFGLANGLQFMLDVLSFAFLIAFIGRIDKTSLAATNITFQINMLAFLPMAGFGIAISTLVGQSLGANKPELAQRITWNTFWMTLTYMILIAIGYLVFPELFVEPFKARSASPDFAVIDSLVPTLLRFVAVYCLFDTGNIIFAAALKGAGDTRFVMFLSGVLSWVIMVIPAWLAVTYKIGPNGGLYTAWAFVTLYVCVLAIAFWLRFRQGRWKSMRVIEAAPAPHAPCPVDLPTVNTDMP